MRQINFKSLKNGSKKSSGGGTENSASVRARAITLAMFSSRLTLTLTLSTYFLQLSVREHSRLLLL